MNPVQLTASDAAQALAKGELSASELVDACVQHITALEERIGAWTHFDADYARKQAANADALRKAGKPLGPLHGIPVGIKDIFDTHDFPTEDGTPLHQGRTPSHDATCVALLRQAGAIIMGKTVTTELAVLSPGKTVNPHDSNRTPGGSSSGSAAAVAAQMVPLAIGSQTNGSVIRPASYCGIVGYKPSHGLISRYRVLQQSERFDHVGVFARTVKDAALLAQSMMHFDARDPAMRLTMPPNLLHTLEQGVPVLPKLAFVKTPVWNQAESDTHQAFAELVDFLGDRVDEVDLDSILQDVIGWHRLVMEADIAYSFRADYNKGKSLLSPALVELIERGREHRAMDYQAAVRHIRQLKEQLDEFMLDYDAILAPATLGEAPLGLTSTGSPAFCTPWTACGMPSITLPLMNGSHGMPIGVQLIAAKGDDARLLRTADWLVTQIAQNAESSS